MARTLLIPGVRTPVFFFAAVLAAAQIATRADRILSPEPPVLAPAPPVGLLESNTLLTVYGRSFATAPILGRLGTYRDPDAMAADLCDRAQAIRDLNGGKGVVEAIHLIYAMAIPCTPGGDCLEYLAPNLVRRYAEIAAARGWALILDSQLGRSNPLDQVRRMIDLGLLRYPNVHVALDPEFHSCPGHDVPGIPIGTVEAAQINQVQSLLDRYVADQHLPTCKILIVHQFGDPAVHDGVPYMIRDKTSLRAFPNVELVIDMDGLGSPLLKVRKYNLITDGRTYPSVRFRGIKIFYRDPGEVRGHFDKPPMTLDQVFGLVPVPGGCRMAAHPDVVIIA